MSHSLYCENLSELERELTGINTSPIAVTELHTLPFIYTTPLPLLITLEICPTHSTLHISCSTVSRCFS